MKDKLPSYQFKVGEQCWCFWHGFTSALDVSYRMETACACKWEQNYPYRPLTLTEAKLLGMEPQKKTKKVTMWQALFKSDLGRYYSSDSFYINEEHARNTPHIGKLVKLINPIEIEVEE